MIAYVEWNYSQNLIAGGWWGGGGGGLKRGGGVGKVLKSESTGRTPIRHQRVSGTSFYIYGVSEEMRSLPKYTVLTFFCFRVDLLLIS